MKNALSESKEPFFYSFYLILYSENEGKWLGELGERDLME